MWVLLSRMMQSLTSSNLLKLLAGIRDHLATSSSYRDLPQQCLILQLNKSLFSGISAWKWKKEKRLYCRTSQHNYQTKITHNPGHKCQRQSIQVALDSWCPEYHFTMTKPLSSSKIYYSGPTVLLVSWVCTAEHSSPECWPTLLNFCSSSHPFPQSGPVLRAYSLPSSTVLDK